ncbi:zinc finger, CCHC-type containing protein, partial [Tanacetum coccineum]
FEDDDGRILLDYVAIKDAVDTTMNLTFYPVKPVRVSGSIMACYGDDVLGDNGFLGQYNAVIFQADPSKFIGDKPQEELPLHKSALAVPANGDLKIKVFLQDAESKDIIMDDMKVFRKSESLNGYSKWKIEGKNGTFGLLNVTKNTAVIIHLPDVSTCSHTKINEIMISNRYMSVVYVLTTLPEDGGDNPTVEQNVESSKELWDSLEAKYIDEVASSKKFLVSNFTNYKMTDSRLVMKQYNELLGILGRLTQHKINMDEAIQVSYIIDKLPPSWIDFKHTLKHLKEELTLVGLDSHLRIEESLIMHDSDKLKGNNIVCPSVVNMVEHNNTSRYNDNKGKRKHHDNTKADPNKNSKDDDVAWLDIVNDNIASAFMSTSKLNDSILWHARLGHVHFKRMQDMFKDGLISAFNMDTEKCKTCMLNKIIKKPLQNVKREAEVLELIHSDLCDLHATPSLRNKKYFMTFIDDASRFCYVYLLHSKDEALDKFKVFKTEVESQQGSQIKRFRTDRGGLSQGFWGEAIYAEHSRAFRFYVIEPNELVLINSIIKSRDAIFNENRFSLVSRYSLRIPNGTKDIGGSVVLEEVIKEVVTQQPEPDLRKGKSNRTPKDFRPEFQLYLIEGTIDEISDQHSYYFNVEDDRKTSNEAMMSHDIAFWKEAINDEMDSIMGNNT